MKSKLAFLSIAVLSFTVMTVAFAEEAMNSNSDEPMMQNSEVTNNMEMNSQETTTAAPAAEAPAAGPAAY